MGWETRRGREYYYRKRREGGRVVSEYVGGVEVAPLVGARSKPKHSSAKRVDELAALDRAIKTNWGDIQQLMATTLVAGGYHNHKGQWRKKRLSRP